MMNTQNYKWDIEKKRIEILMNNLAELGDYPVDASISIQLSFAKKFFNIVAFFQDSGKIKFAPTRKHKVLRLFEQSIFLCGRIPSGINRTIPGEVVTLDDIWLPSFHQYFSCSLAYHLRESSPEQIKLLIETQLRPLVEQGRIDILRESKDLIS